MLGHLTTASCAAVLVDRAGQPPYHPSHSPRCETIMNVVTTDFRRCLQRQISGLGMEDPIFKSGGCEWPTHPSLIYDDMSYQKVPDDMKDLVTVDSDPTAPLSMSCSTLLTSAKSTCTVAPTPDPAVAQKGLDDDEHTRILTKEEASELWYRSLCSLTVDDLESPSRGDAPRPSNLCHRQQPTAARMVSPGNSPVRAVRDNERGRSATKSMELSLPSLSNDVPAVVRRSRSTDDPDARTPGNGSMESFHESLYSLLTSQSDLSLAGADNEDDDNDRNIRSHRLFRGAPTSSEEQLLRELSHSLTEQLHVTKESLRPPPRRAAAATTALSTDGSDDFALFAGIGKDDEDDDATTSAGVVPRYPYRYPDPGTDVPLPLGHELRALPSLVDLFPPLPLR